jgi:hypothetical protein
MVEFRLIQGLVRNAFDWEAGEEKPKAGLKIAKDRKAED